MQERNGAVRLFRSARGPQLVPPRGAMRRGGSVALDGRGLALSADCFGVREVVLCEGTGARPVGPLAFAHAVARIPGVVPSARRWAHGSVDVIDVEWCIPDAQSVEEAVWLVGQDMSIVVDGFGVRLRRGRTRPWEGSGRLSLAQAWGFVCALVAVAGFQAAMGVSE